MAWRALLIIRETDLLPSNGSMLAKNRYDRLDEFLILEEEIVSTRLSKRCLERLVSKWYSLSERFWGLSKSNLLWIFWWTICDRPRRIWTSDEFNSWNRIVDGLIWSIAFDLIRLSIRWSEQHRAPSGIQIFRVNNRKSRVAEDVCCMLFSFSRQMQHVLRIENEVFLNRVSLLHYLWEDVVEFNYNLTVSLFAVAIGNRLVSTASQLLFLVNMSMTWFLLMKSESKHLSYTEPLLSWSQHHSHLKIHFWNTLTL